MIAILSDEAKQGVGRKVYEALQEKGRKVVYIATNGLNLKTCYSCGYCQTKEYGKCVHQDDMQEILSKLIGAEQLVIVTPLTWGSYSSHTKKVLDRMCVIGDFHYGVAGGEIIKGMRSNMKELIAIGVKEQWSVEEEKNFSELVLENYTIMGVKGRAVVIKEEQEIEALIREVGL